MTTNTSLTYPLLMGLLGGSAIFDVESTMALKNRGGAEANPLMKPFVEGGRIPTYAVQAGGVVLQKLLADELRKRNIKAWWVPLAVNIAAHTAAGILNTRK